MMKPFLTQLVEKIAAHSETPLENTLIVVPNERAKRELFRALTLHYTQPVFAPEIRSVNEFIETLSSLKKIDNSALLVRLFEVYRKKNREKSNDFAGFLTWAPIFLQDINEIDLHLANAADIFSNLSEIKTLETSLGKENLTEMQKKYLTFYSQLADLYIDFTETLRTENLGYEGMIYRDAANKVLNHTSHKENTIHRYIFAGLNAVTPSELEVIHYFYVHKNAEIYFDTDTFYHENYGVFIEEIRQKLRIPEIPKSNDYVNIPKQISCIGAPKRTAQVYQTIEILNAIKEKQGNLNDTVLVFADESMLLPFVHAYNIEDVNITMGYPLGATFAAQKLLQLIEEEKKNRRDLDFTIFEYFLKEEMKATPIPFDGNTHEGLQIMGLLETRMLDFKNVIILSMNEGVLPKGKAASSLLLYDIKRHFGLPTHRRTDAIFGYHFFRLLQRATEVYLIYDNETSDTLAEESRFIKQLAFEVKKQQLQKSIHLFEKQYLPAFKLPEKENKISIEKTKTIIEKLINFKYSPTSLNTYIQCPLQFYFKFIEEISVPRTFDQTTESAIIGTVIHKVLEEIFKEIKENPAQFSNILSKYENTIEDVLTRVFRAQPEIGNEEITTGKLYLAFQIVRKSIADYIKIIRKEWENEPFQIIATENTLKKEVSLGTHRLCLKGTVDRIEIRDNKVTILDYKTGKVDAKKLQCGTEDFETVFTNPENSQLLQLLCYAYLYKNCNCASLVPATEFQCGIISFQEIYQQNADYICYAKIDKEQVLTKEHLQLFETQLKKVFSAILDEEIAFSQTQEAGNCEFCDYRGICNL